MPLTDVSIRNAKPTERLQKLSDGGGLYLAVLPTGGKSWRFKYRYAGKEKLLTFGTWPDVSLAAARRKREEARRLLADGIDPGAERQAERARRDALAANTLEAVAREWIERHLSKKSEAYRERVVSQLERFAFPAIGDRPIAELTAPEILEVVRRVERLGILETAHRARQVIGQVIRYAIATGRAQADPTPALRGALPARTDQAHGRAGRSGQGRGDTARTGGLPRYARGCCRYPAAALCIRAPGRVAHHALGRGRPGGR
jgi:hypothetical protein